MIHARLDYNRIQDPARHNPELLGRNCSVIENDEPVFLLRAKDMLFIPMIKHYLSLLNDAKGDADDPIITSLEMHIQRAGEWQEENGCKLPDMNEDDINNEGVEVDESTVV